MRRVCGLAASLVAMSIVSGCAGSDSENTSDRVDPRVLSAATPIPGSDSYYDRIWVLTKIDNWRIDGIRDCLERNGRKDLWPRAEEPILNEARLLDTRVLSKKMLEEVGIDPRRAPDSHSEIHEKDKVLWDCSDGGSETPGDGAQWTQAFNDLEYAWDDELDKVLDDPKYDGGKQKADRCITSGGGQLNTHDDGSTGKGWEGDFVYGASSKDAMTDEQAKAAGKLLVKCAQPLWDEWSTELEPKRADFAEKHNKDLAEISSAVDSAG